MHHGLGLPDNWRNSRAPSKERGFFHGEHELHGMASFFGGLCWGTRKGAPVPIAGSPT